jgi:hypothetical protein
MWNKQLASRAASYPTAVLSIVEHDSYPLSIRCNVQLDADRQLFTIQDAPAWVSDWRGKASLLFHTHDERLQHLRQLLILGELVDETGVLTLQVTKFVTANGRQDSDEMPHAASPFHMLKFFWLGWRSARAYIAKRGTPWPPIPYDEIERAITEETAKKQSNIPFQ